MTTETPALAAPPDLLESLHWDKGDGLLPLIVQHAHDGRVLMLGWCDRQADAGDGAGAFPFTLARPVVAQG